jgi:hypothetical protein
MKGISTVDHKMTAASTGVTYYYTAYGLPLIHLSSFVPTYVTFYSVFYIYKMLYILAPL